MSSTTKGDWDGFFLTVCPLFPLVYRPSFVTPLLFLLHPKETQIEPSTPKEVVMSL